MKRTALYAALLVVAFGCLCAMTCEPPVTDPGDLEGSWTLVTTPGGGRDLGTGSFSVVYKGTDSSGGTNYVYEGTGTLLGVPHDVAAIQTVDDAGDDPVYVQFGEQAKPANILMFFGSIDSAGDSMYDGTYVPAVGSEHDEDFGTFTATKN